MKHEPKVAELSDKLTAIGLKPFHLPLGILLDQKEDGFATPTSACIRCTAFDGFPCLLNGKADAQVICIDPMLAKHDNVTLMTERLCFEARDGCRAGGGSTPCMWSGAESRRSIQPTRWWSHADRFPPRCSCCAPPTTRHPNGLANGSDQVGRNYMRHEMSIVMAVMRHVNDTVFQKTLAFSDFYFGSDDWDYPLGLIQMCAISHADQIKGEALPGWLEWLPDMPFERDRAPFDGFLAAVRGPAPSGQPRLLQGRQGASRSGRRPTRRRSSS